MRSEALMFDLILELARSDERIRAVVLNGSRVNPNMPRDIFQDFDVVYFVDDIAPYIHNPAIIRYFGDTIIYQLPDEMGDAASRSTSSYAYLMQFTDGNRIDLTFCLLSKLKEALQGDGLSKILLDKDDRCGKILPPSDLGYLPVPPTEKQFDDCCNEFWWLMPYTAKGLWRREMIAPKYYQDVILHGELRKMLTWYYGIQTDFSRSPGKLGRFFEQQFNYDLWGVLKSCFSGANSENVWESLYTMGDLFRRIAQDVAHHFGFSYPHQDDSRVTEFIALIQTLPPDVSSFDP